MQGRSLVKAVFVCWIGATSARPLASQQQAPSTPQQAYDFATTTIQAHGQRQTTDRHTEFFYQPDESEPDLCTMRYVVWDYATDSASNSRIKLVHVVKLRQAGKVTFGHDTVFIATESGLKDFKDSTLTVTMEKVGAGRYAPPDTTIYVTRVGDQVFEVSDSASAHAVADALTYLVQSCGGGQWN